MDRPSIAVSPYSPLTPVFRNLAGKGFEFWTPTPDHAKSLIDLDFPARPLGELVGQRNLADEAYADAARILAAGAKQFSRNGRGPDLTALSPPAAAFLREKATAFLYPRLFDLCALVKALDASDAEAVLVHNDVEPQTRAMCLWAAARNVPSLHVPHAIYQDVNRGGPGTDVHDLVTAEWLASAGPVQTEWYEARGFPKDKIVETGRPALDPWARNDSGMDGTRARRLLRLPPRAKVATYCSTWTQMTNRLGANDQWIDAYHSFLLACRSLGLEAVVKCHPHGGARNWQWHANEAGRLGVPCSVTPEHLEVCLWAADVMVAFGGSNTILEGAFVPGLRLLSTHGYEGESAVGRAPLDPDGMRDALREALEAEQPDVSGLKTRWVGEADGRAAERVTGLILDLVQA